MSSPSAATDAINNLVAPYINIRIFFDTYLCDIDNNNNATRDDDDDQPVRILVNFTQQFVTHNHNLSRDGGVRVESTVFHSNHPRRVFDSAENVRPVFEAMVDSFVPSSVTSQLHWVGCESDNQGTSSVTILDGINEVVNRYSEAAARIVREAGESSVTIEVRVFRQTVVEAEQYDSLMIMFHFNTDDVGIRLSNEEDDEDEGSEESEMAAAELMELVRYYGDGGEGLECAICLKKVLSGTHVARLPCSHRFHGDCIFTWLVKSQTCPLCRWAKET